MPTPPRIFREGDASTKPNEEPRKGYLQERPMKTTLIAAFASLAIAPMAIIGSAGAEDYSMSVDRDALYTSDGPAKIYAQIEAQADDICDDVLHGTRELTRQRRCEARVIALAVEQINDARLTAYHKQEAVTERYSELR